MLCLIQWLWFLVGRIKCCWSLRGVAMLDVFREHVDMSGTVLIHFSSLSPTQQNVHCFDAFR